MFGSKKARLAKHIRKGLLRKVLGILARAAQPPRCSVQPVDVIPQLIWVQLTLAAHPLPRRIRRGRKTRGGSSIANQGRSPLVRASNMLNTDPGRSTHDPFPDADLRARLSRPRFESSVHFEVLAR